MSGLTIYTYPNNYRVQKALVCAQYAGVGISLPEFEFGKDNKTPDFLKHHPTGKVPAMMTPDGPIFESNAIAKYVAGLRADKNLLGGSYYENALVQQWIDFCANEVETARAVWVYPMIGVMAYNADMHAACVADMNKAMKVVDGHLLNHTFMVGESITLADITLVAALQTLMAKCFGPAFRAAIPNVVRWYETVMGQEQVAAVMGKVEYCAEDPAGAAPAAGKKASKAAPAPAAVAAPALSAEAEKAIAAAGEKVRALKSAKAGKEEITAAVAELLAVKTKFGVAPAAQSKADKKKEEKAAKKAGGGKAKKDDKKAAPAKKEGGGKKAELSKEQIKKNKAALKEGGKKGQDLAGMATFGVSFFCADMQEPAGDMALLELCMQGANAEVDPEGEDRKGGAGDLGKVFFSNGDDMLSMICHVPKELHAHTTAKEFFGYICDKVGAVLVGEQTEFMLRAQVKKDVDAGRFPIKLKDEALSAGFAFLRSKSLILEDDDSGDDINFADDCGIDLNAGASSDY